MSRRSSLRVALDLTPLPSAKAGVGRYALGLLKGLLKAIEDGRVQLVCIVTPRDVEEVLAQAPGAEIIEAGPFLLGRAGRIAWEQTVLPALLKKCRADLFHGIHYTVALRSRLPQTVVFHDPTFWTNPAVHTRLKVAYFRRMAWLASKRVRLVFTVSNWSKNTLCAVLRLPPEKVRVTYHGVDESLLERASQEEIQRFRDSIAASDAKLIVFIGTIEPRKNIPRLAMAVELLRERIKDQSVLLAVAGQRGWMTNESEKWLERGERQGWIRRLGYVDEAQKRLLLQSADAFVYPSLAEGFGIPIVEAFASGTPVVTSNRGATAEIANGAAVLINPYDVVEMTRAMEKILCDPAKAERLRELGAARASEFTWEKTAQSTMEGWLAALSTQGD